MCRAAKAVVQILAALESATKKPRAKAPEVVRREVEMARRQSSSNC